MSWKIIDDYWNIWMICLDLNWLFYEPSWMLQLSEFVGTLRSSAWVVFHNFLLVDATKRSKISSDQMLLMLMLMLMLIVKVNVNVNIVYWQP